ncbi:thiamine pyrophosphate-binding protein [Mycobacterium sp. DL592]|uniref:thiamine pyrophosphate-binding protein n=1 Tax=Mycobacterium sp. DL592 TaxID=2675524 RepID=UPI0014242132|nr:thiamine pyrophosphate-dependent enzyme [Mycobacterium sp. DL592]
MPVSADPGAGTGRLRVVDYIAAHLAHRGIQQLFGVDGANIEDLYDAVHAHPQMTAVVAKHEFSAAAMADAYSRTAPTLGVVIATSGGGALNTVAGLGESLASRVPVLALIGQSATADDGRGPFQDTSGVNGTLDAAALFAAVSVFCRRVTTPADITTALPAALHAATRHHGPAALLLPKNIQQSLIDAPADDDIPDAPQEPADLRPLIEMLAATAGPVTIVAGDQVGRDDARAELAQLQKTLDAAVATEPDAKDAAPAALGVAGVMGHPAVRTAIAGSAACLLVGSRMPGVARNGLDDALAAIPIGSLGSAPPHLPGTHVHTDDLKSTLAQLAAALRTRPSTPHHTAPTELTPPEHTGPGVAYRDAMVELDAAMRDDTDIAVDAGNIGASAIHWLPARRGGRFLVALGMGGMGYSFGAGIGMAFAHRRRTVVIAGDGSFYMHGMEIHTAIQHQLPVTFVLFDNQAHAMCVTREQLFYGGRYSYNRFGPSRLGAGLAAMFPGLPCTDVADVAELATALKAALAADGPSVVAVECSADEIPPFTAFLASTAKDNR